MRTVVQEVADRTETALPPVALAGSNRQPPGRNEEPDVARTLAHLSDHRLLELFRELPHLPARDLSLLVPLPEFVSPELGRLYRAITDDDIDRAEELLPAVLERIDTPQTRARLADAVADLEAAGRLDALLAAAALMDLDSRSDILINASLIEAAALAAGATRTPGGLLLAA